MKDKKPVYNGYEERYIKGKELKNHFINCYYATGKHHSVILGITIPDYLDLLNVDEDTEYRIFINKYFCRVMDGKTDRLISFFGYHLIENMVSSKNSSQKICPLCGAPMKFKEGRFGEFLGCSQYPKCKHSVKIPLISKI